MLVVALNIFVFAGEKSQDAGIQRTEPEVWDFKFDFSVEQFFMIFYNYKSFILEICLLIYFLQIYSKYSCICIWYNID